jgi:8-hydroxy-5-deazaflavin:NADPH oxidoreductase
MHSSFRSVGIVGSSTVGQVLGDAFLQEGHAVMLGTRDPSKDTVVKWYSSHPKAKMGTFADAAAFGDIVVLALNGMITEAVVAQLATSLQGKVIIDATNPIAAAPPIHGVLRYFTTLDDALLERLQRVAPKARFVKAFNSVGNQYFYKPSFQDGKPTMFICGNDEPAKAIVKSFLDDFGWETADMGPVEAARAIEPLCMLWCIPGLASNQWTHAFKLLKQ